MSDYVEMKMLASSLGRKNALFSFFYTVPRPRAEFLITFKSLHLHISTLNGYHLFTPMKVNAAKSKIYAILYRENDLFFC